MKHLIRCATLVVALCLSVSARAAGHVFGVDWQSTPSQLRSQGIALKLQKTQGRLSMYETTTLPKNLSDAETYLLIFDKTRGLVKIIMVGRSFTRDPDGTQGKQRFDQLGSLLHQRGYEMLDKPQARKMKRASGVSFYACLAQPSCGVWKSAYRKDHVLVSMQLNGMPGGHGFITMSFEEQPQFQQSLADNHDTTMAKDAEAF